MTFDYFFGQQAEMFTFYRVPKVLFTEDCFWNVSTDAKLLYGILLDRMNLSARNGWLDEEGRVFIIFTIEEIKGALGCAEKKAVKLLEDSGIPQEVLKEEKAEVYEQLSEVNRNIRAERGKLKLCREICRQTPAMEQDIQKTEEHQKEVREHEHRRR